MGKQLKKQLKFERNSVFFSGEYAGETYRIKCGKCGKVLLQYLEPDQGLELMLEDLDECEHYEVSRWGEMAIENSKKSKKDFEEEEKKAIYKLLNGDEIILILPKPKHTNE